MSIATEIYERESKARYFGRDITNLYYKNDQLIKNVIISYQSNFVPPQYNPV